VSDPMRFSRHIAELNATNHALVRSYAWGLDLSETLDGAGGVGGLLWVNQHSASSAGAHFCTYDGNGNVWQLVAASTGTETGRYEYGPFDDALRTTGPAAASSSFRFSTKRTDPASGLVLYAYRIYRPIVGRWLTRDPLAEQDGWNLYQMVQNTPTEQCDQYGLRRVEYEVQDWWVTWYTDILNQTLGTQYLSYSHYLLVWGETRNGVRFHAYGKDSAEGRLTFAQFPAGYKLKVHGPNVGEKDGPCPVQCISYTSEYMAFLGIKSPYIDVSMTLAASTISITICADGEIIVR